MTEHAVMCPEHGLYLVETINHIRGQGCPVCGVKGKWETPPPVEKKARKDSRPPIHTTEEFVALATAAHGERYDYSESEYVNCTTKVRIICRKHGPFMQLSNSHLRGSGCPICGGARTIATDSYVEEVDRLHKRRYDYTHLVYKGAWVPVHIICRKHGSFFPLAINHMLGEGCPKCDEENEG